jgi:DNA-directed RNA polymerase specialized sigma24 family protein
MREIERSTIVSSHHESGPSWETTMSDEGDVTQWLRGLKTGDQEAARKLWGGYFDRLVRLVERKLPAQTRRVSDEEDVALSAFESFCAGVVGERFPDLSDRGNLWAILVVIATRKAQAYVEAQNRLKRGGGEVRGDSVFVGRADGGEVEAGFDALVGKEPSPAFIAQASEACERLLDALGDETLRNVAVLKMQGFSIEEIAAQVGCTKRAVERRLEIIRRTWREQAPDEA